MHQNSIRNRWVMQGNGEFLWYHPAIEDSMEDKITIIEGPPPVFESVDDGWALGLNESPALYTMALTRLRTFNGTALVERCHHMWQQKEPIYLHYRNPMGLEEKVPILAARASETEDGQVLYLWIRRSVDDESIELPDNEN